jgi:type VII secretion-associated serine protease mycosin
MVEVSAKDRSAGHRVTQRTVLRRLSSAAGVAALLAIPLATAAPAQAYSSQQWALDYLNANQDWQVSKGSGITVAVIDTGVASIPDLSGRVSSGADFSSNTTSSGNGETDTDSGGHGTGMAVLIAGNGSAVEGLAPDASIMPIRVMLGAGGFTDSDLSAGIQYAIGQHAGVINLSLGATQAGPETTSAIAQAVAANIVVVAASGNETSSSVDYPAALPGVIAVGAVDQSGQVWSQSNTGSRVSLTAPGVNIYRDNNLGQQGTESGTSEATAYVSATAALIRSAHPTWTAGQVIRDLINTATPGSGQSAGQHSDQYGYGIISPLKALQASAPSDTSNPLLSSASSGSSAAANPGASSTASGTAASSSSSSHTGLTIGAIVAVIVVIGIVLLLVMRSRRGRGPKPPTGPGYGGYPQQPYQQDPYQGQSNPYSQQNPYQQQNPYGQHGQNQPPYPPQQQ